MELCHQCGTPTKEGDRFCPRCGATLRTSQDMGDPMIGRTVGGSYVLNELVGVGGMGRVYRAEQGILGRTVAIKLIHPHLLGDEQTVARFYTEARAASRLNHPNSVSVIDFGRTDDGQLYLVMEYLGGKDLARVMTEEGPLPFARICDILCGVLDALDEAHELGIVHRDLKPENIILKPSRSGPELVKVVDFGLAVLLTGTSQSGITTPGLVCGTPDYMSPEQGRGEQVDGRGDIYAAGVMLFELLTERLPFPDETPTKVVLRHIHDPIPDPRQIAPHRGIPPGLAAITMKALSKSAAERYQKAEDMRIELKRAAESLRPPKAGERTCPECGARSPSSMRFCGSCGARLTDKISLPPGVRPTPSAPATTQPPVDRALVGRNDEVSKLEQLREGTRQRTVRARIIGEPGVGKTRLLLEATALAALDGDVVVSTGPHPSGAPVPYAAAATALAGLLDVSVTDLPALLKDRLFEDPLARAGLEELIEPTGLIGFDGVARSGAVAAALATGVRASLARSKSGRTMLAIDDLPRCDTLSQLVFGELSRAELPLFVVSTGASLIPTVDESAVTITLVGLDDEEVVEFFFGGGTGAGTRPSRPPAPAETLPEGRRLLPLYLEQARALGASVGGDDTLPTRLADILLQRVDRLDVSARRALQTAAVLGDSCSLMAFRAVAQTDDLAGLPILMKQGLIRVEADSVGILHPFVRELVEASIPAEARKRLHERALQWASDANEPLEVRAEHAYRAGEPIAALVLLERMGDLGLTRGDAQAAVLAFRRGLDLARREMLDTGETILEGAILTFSRKLGEALERAGDAAGADGVLREALDHAGPASLERARLLVVIGRVAARRDRRRDALRVLGSALEVAERVHDADVEAQVQIAMARVRREEGDHVGASNAYRRTAERLEKAAATPARRARVFLELGELCMDLGDSAGAADRLDRAWNLAMEAKTPALAATVLGALATMDELEGEKGRAAARYREASRLSAQAGDAEGHQRWQRAAATLSQSSPKVKAS